MCFEALLCVLSGAHGWTSVWTHDKTGSMRLGFLCNGLPPTELNPQNVPDIQVSQRYSCRQARVVLTGEDTVVAEKEL
jgi:hypothetical protein